MEKKITSAQIETIRFSIQRHLDKNGDMTMNEIKAGLKPNCSKSIIQGELKKWREKQKKEEAQASEQAQIQEEKEVQVLEQASEQVQVPEQEQVQEEKEELETELKELETELKKKEPEYHRFTCSASLEAETYKFFKLILAFKGEHINVLLARWITDHVRENKSSLSDLFKD